MLLCILWHCINFFIAREKKDIFSKEKRYFHFGRGKKTGFGPPSPHSVSLLISYFLNTVEAPEALCCLIAKPCPTFCNPMNCSTTGFPVLHYLPEFAKTLVHWVSNAIQPSHPLSPSSPPAFNLAQHQGLFLWVGSSHQVAKVMELQLQHQSFPWTPRTDLL